MDRSNAALNRTGLAVVGVILVLVGVAALARGLGLWPGLLGAADAAVTDPRTRELTGDHTWFWALLVVLLVALVLLALGWLLSQSRTTAVHTLRVETDPRHGITVMPARVATGALEAELAAGPHFRDARATLLGSPTRPRLYLTATLLSGTDFGLARQRLAEALQRQQQALDTPELPATVLLRATR